MINKELVRNKLCDMQSYFEELKPILKEESRDIIENNLKLHTTERLFQLLADTAIDINTHIIAEAGFETPDDYQSSFVVLGEHKIFPMEFVWKIAPSVGLRNLVVHKYGKVDIKRMVDDIKNEIGDFFEYMKYMESYLQKLS